MTAAQLEHVDPDSDGNPAAAAADSAKEVHALHLRVDELEQQLRQRDAQLCEEKERGERARKKLKQLLGKLSERDARLAEQSDVLTELKTALREVVAKQSEGGSTEKREKRRDRTRSSLRAEEGRDNAIRERVQIVHQLEGHLAQMRANLGESERELLELEEMKLIKEAEWSAHSAESAEDAGGYLSASPQTVQVHWQRLSMITQQLQEKRSFAAELTQKTKELEEGLAQQNALIDELRRSNKGDDKGRSVRTSVDESEVRNAIDAGLRASVALAAAELAASRAAAQAAGALVEMPRGPRHSVDVQRNEALQAFLAAAGSTAEVVLARPALHAAFETRPLELSVGALDDCSSDERLQAISLFVAYTAVTGDKALRLSDIGLRLAEAVEIGNTLESCGAELEEWEMTRCPTNEATMRVLLRHLTSHPLRRLNLGYNALGPVGASALMTSTGPWSANLERLSLEMNGLGDNGCDELARALASGKLPALESLELGWNELSAACAEALASLLEQRHEAANALPLRKLGLGGNKLGSDGACTLVAAALAHPKRELELDLSMNHVGVLPVRSLTEWVESDVCRKVEVTVILEWNVIDDAGAVTRLSEAVSRSAGLSSCGKPLVRLANNELHELRAQDVLAETRGLVSC